MYKESLTAEQATIQMLSLLKRPVQCALCGRESDRITPGHLRMHAAYLRSKRGIKWYRPMQEHMAHDVENMQSSSQGQTIWKSRDEKLIETYERLFGGKDELTSCVKKVLDLYRPHRGKWLVMDKPVLPMYAKWQQVSSDNPAFRPNRLCVTVLKEHLLLKCTVGVFPKSQYQTFFVTWDIDASRLPEDSTWDPAIGARNAAIAVVALLRKWGLHPHVAVSGKKGFHVTVFFNTGVSIKLAKHLFKAALQHPDGPVTGPGLKIECLPIERGNKLPLGVHWGADTYCGFVDPFTLEPLADPYGYLLDIIADSLDVLYEIKDEGLANRMRESTVITQASWSKSQTEAAFKIGITSPGTRHDTTLRVAAYVRNTPSLCPGSLNELIAVLLRWSRKQYEQNGSNIGTPWSEHERDIDRIAKYVWNSPLSPGVPQAIRITAATVHWIRSQTSALAEQQLLFAAWVQMSQTGERFHLGYKQAQKMTALAKESLDKASRGLRDKGILVVEEEYFHGANGIIPSKTRKYRFGNPPPSNSTSVLVTMTQGQWDASLWFRLLRALFTPEQLKAYYRHAYHRILRVEPVSLGRSTA